MNHKRTSHLKGKLLIFLLAALCICTPLIASAQEGAGARVNNFITEDGLVNGVPSTVAVDPGGWVWIGTKTGDNANSSGFSIINSNKRIITFEKQNDTDVQNISNIRFDEKNGAIWFATLNGLYRWDTKTGAWKTFNSTNSGLSENKVTNVYVDKNGNVFIATNGGGIYTMDPAAGTVQQIKSPFMSITGLVIDSKGRLWASSSEGIAYRQDNVWVTYNKANSSIPIDQVDAVIEHSDGTILGATQRGIIVYDGFRWTVIDTSNSKMPVDLVTGFLPDGSNGMWVSTNGGGVAHMNKNRDIDRVYSRKNLNILDNRVLAMALDDNYNLWLGTNRGVSQVVLNAPRTGRTKVTSITAQGYDWDNCSRTPDKPVTLQLGLVRPYYTPLSWGWMAFFADKGYDPIEPQISLESSLLNNQWINISGQYSGAQFVQVAQSEGDTAKNMVIERDRAFPFPDKFPAEIAIYLRPGTLLPSDDTDISNLAKSLVKNSSRGDMLKTTEDILFSSFFATMPYDYDNTVESSVRQPECTNPRVGVYRTPQEVVKDNEGISYTKNRLAVTLLKAAGVPSRLVAGNGETYWGEAYINGIGWVPFDVTMPVYAIDDDHIYRVQFPYGFQEDNMGVVSVSSSDDNLRQLVWEPTDNAIISRRDPERTKELIKPEKMKTAKFLLIYPAQTESLEINSKIPVAPNVYMTVHKEHGIYNVKFYDQNNKLLSKTPIVKYDTTMTAGSEGDFTLTFIPTMMSDHIMLQILGWDYYELPSSSTTTTAPTK